MITIGLLALAALVSASAPSAPAPPTTVAAAVPTTAAAAAPTTLPTAPTTTTTTTTTMPSGPTTTIPIPEGYTPLADDTNTIVIAVPAAWQDVLTAQYIPEEGTAADAQPSIVASPNIDAFYVSFDVPGVSYFAVPFLADPLMLISQFGITGGCATLEAKEYDDPVFAGYVQVGTDCGPLHMTWNMVVANPIGSDAFTVIMQVQTADPAELETVLRTFNVAG